jgi:hypothetical protein
MENSDELHSDSAGPGCSTSRRNVYGGLTSSFYCLKSTLRLGGSLPAVRGIEARIEAGPIKGEACVPKYFPSPHLKGFIELASWS